MHVQDELKDFFAFIQHDCISYHMERKQDGSIHLKWRDINVMDYQPNQEETIQRINIRLQKMKTGGFLLDCFQWYGGNISWEAFPITTCVGYRVVPSQSENCYDMTFHFTHRDLQFSRVTLDMVFLLQQFFGDGFI